MEPITTAVAAITAASNAISFIKARINDVQSVTEISGQISTLFDAQKKLNEERNKQASVSDISFKGSLDAVLEAKKLQEQMQEIKTMINLRFGPNTWQEIVDHHNKALREQKEAQAQARREAARKAKEIEETIKATLLVAGIILVAIALFAFLFVTVAQSNVEEIIL
jgi:polyribonucleotide nucleotidyltransferase|tara:strand:+ start:168 stop:668 length:501 start_codon:yes stop_codon:yes gene_type:complete